MSNPNAEGGGGPPIDPLLGDDKADDDGPRVKTCTHCHVEKPTKQFVIRGILTSLLGIAWNAVTARSRCVAGTAFAIDTDDAAVEPVSDDATVCFRSEAWYRLSSGARVTRAASIHACYLNAYHLDTETGTKRLERGMHSAETSSDTQHVCTSCGVIEAVFPTKR
ncbi:unnamed protein product [Clonostachys rhizophaga]|uniref:Uncharacterized protein n=1 Tax=Clonostachys rhizophaga TaxID=160324 RepID=A0A9N9V5Z2_9HYPO|nr:unnamed protein product [Clonostachys rhizophaga]